MLIQMSNTYTQTTLFAAPLPAFIQSFKTSILNTIIPPLNAVISDLQNPNSKHNSIVTLLCLILFVLILREIFTFLFAGRNKVVNHVPGQKEIDQQIRALSHEIKGLKNTIKKIIQQGNKDTATIQQNVSNNSATSNANSQGINKLVTYYRQSAEDYNNLANYILDSQETIFKELKNLKKLKVQADRNSSHASHTSHGSLDQNTVQIMDQIKEKQVIQSKILEPEFKPPAVFDIKKEDEQVEDTKQETIPQVKPVVISRPKFVPPPAGGAPKRRVVPPPPAPK